MYINSNQIFDAIKVIYFSLAHLQTQQQLPLWRQEICRLPKRKHEYTDTHAHHVTSSTFTCYTLKCLVSRAFEALSVSLVRRRIPNKQTRNIWNKSTRVFSTNEIHFCWMYSLPIHSTPNCSQTIPRVPVDLQCWLWEFNNDDSDSKCNGFGRRRKF